jgi:sugar-specific transcriptional regulator TrmB/DNA-binding CsgD family transcriptional regulator
MLEDAGLRPEEERAYRVLVRLATAGAAELAERLDLPAEQAARLLDTLRVRGLATAVQSEASSGNRYRPLPPDTALAGSLLRRQESLDKARQAIADLAEEYRASVRRRDADQLVEVVTGTTALRERLRQLQDSAREEMLWFCRANHIAMPSADNAEEFSALRRGVRYRVIYERALLEEPGMIENVAAGVHAGEQARALPTLPVRLAIADRQIAVCPLVPGGGSGLGEPTAALIRPSQLLDSLLALFESYWDRATPVGAHDEPPDPEQPTGEERLLLSLLVAGVPDKSIASQLGVSRRTVQRRLWELMARAGVDTRPGLAYQAARRGWI